MTLDRRPFNPDHSIDPRMDAVFKTIFTRDTPESRTALKELLSALIGLPIAKVRIRANEEPLSLSSDRRIRYDINCTLNGGERADIEMTLYPAAHEAARMEYLISRLFSSQDIRGSGKNFQDLKRTYQISIFGKEPFFRDEYYEHRFVYYDPERKVILGGQTAILTLELMKLGSVLVKPVREMSVKEKWAVFFGYHTDPGKRELLGEIIEGTEGIRMAETVLESLDEEDRAILREREELYEADLRSREAEWQSRGQEKERLRILELLDQGLSVDEVKRQLVSRV